MGIRSSHFAFVPSGGFFYEKNAYMGLGLSADLPQNLDSLLNRLRNLLRMD